MPGPPKYPSTPHWPQSQTVHRDDSLHKNPDRFLGDEVMITEKLDGGNTCLCAGEVYARSVQAPSHDGWMSLVRKHHAWKLNANDRCLYGEDLFGVHSIEYAPIKEDETFRVFAMRYFNPRFPCVDNGWFADWDFTEKMAQVLKMKMVPVLYRGKFNSTKEITKFFEQEIKEPSVLGGDREGFVMRVTTSFQASDFGNNVCKYVRANHVQTDEHWRKNWTPCKLAK